MRLFKSIAIVFVMVLLAMVMACSSSSDGKVPFFQNNTGSTDPLGGSGSNPFAGFPDFLDPVTSVVDPQTFVNAFDPTGGLWLGFKASAYEQFADNLYAMRHGSYGVPTVSAKTPVDQVLTKVDGIANTLPYGQSGRGIYGLMAALKNIMTYTINQEDYNSPNDSYQYYTTDLYSFLQRIYNANKDVKTDAYNIGFKTLLYLDNVYARPHLGTEPINAMMSDLNSFLADSSGQTFSLLLLNFQEGMGKILMRADSNIQYDDPLDWDGAGTHDIKLGNAVSGVDFLLKGIGDMVSHDTNAKQDLYDIIREAGKLLGMKSAGNFVFKNKIKQLLIDINDYLTFGGSQFNANYSNTSNPYVNAELRNTVRDLWPGLAKLFIRQRAGGATDPDYSIYRDSSPTPVSTRSPLEWLTITLQQLKTIGIDYSVAGNEMEPSLRRMIQYNAVGTSANELNRTTAGYKMPFLNHLLATIAGGYYFGYLTREVSPADASGEPYDNQSCSEIDISYQHGAATGGILTLNDNMYSWTSTGGVHVHAVDPVFSSAVLDEWTDAYELVLAHRTEQGPYVWRANTTFTYNDAKKSNYEFYMGYDFPALCLLPSANAGDAGIPNGGQKAITPTSDSTTVGDANNDFRTYFPRVADGVGNLNTSNWIFGWIARACSDGAGPYYCTIGGGTRNNSSSDGYPAWPGKSGSYNYYLKPNGEVYAYVDKSGSPYVYYYPANGNDAVDPDASANGQRFNRYRDILKSDYYMAQKGRPHARTAACGLIEVSPANGTTFCVPPMNPSGSSYVDVGGRGKYYLLDGNFNASYFQLYEKVQEWTNTDIANAGGDTGYSIIGNISRECASQEEAMFRNYQWLMLEKKFMFVIPQSLYADWICFGLATGVHAYLDSAAFVVIEANGIVGLTNAKKGSSNGVWNMKNSEGTGTNPVGHRNNPDYGDSLRPGDSRILAWAEYYTNPNATSGVPLDSNTIYGLFGSGNVMPKAVGANIAPVAKLGFVDQTSYITSSFNIGDASWTSRNRLLPIFVALAGVLKDGTYYQPVNNGTKNWGDSGYNYNYNYTGKHKYAVNELLEGVMIPLTKPLMRYWTDAQAFGGSSSTGRWVPRMKTESGNFSYFTPLAYAASDYYPLSSLRTLTGLLAEHDPSAASLDGLLCMLADGPSGTPAYKINSKLVTKLLSLLQRLGSNDANYADSGLAIRQNFFKGLEQIITSIQVSKGEVVSSRSNINNSRYGWMFTDQDGGGIGTTTATTLTDTGTPAKTWTSNAFTGMYVVIQDSPVPIRINSNTATVLNFTGNTNIGAGKPYKIIATRGTPVSVNLDTALNQLIGDGSTMGISKYVDDHNPAGWTENDRLWDTLGALLGDQSTPAYYMTEDLINIVDKMLTATTATSTDLKALRHTLGVLMARYYSGIWKPTTSTPTDSELYQILHQYLPDILNAYNSKGDVNRYDYLILALRGLFDYNFNDNMEPETLNYLIDLLVPQNDAQGIIEGLNDLVSRQAMWDPAYQGTQPNSHSTWQELADICETIAAAP